MIEILRSEQSAGRHVRAAVRHLYGVHDEAVGLGEDRVFLRAGAANAGRGRRLTPPERGLIFEAVRARDADNGELLSIRVLASAFGCAERTISLHRAAIIRAEELVAEQLARPLRSDPRAASAFTAVQARRSAVPDDEATLDAARALCALKRERTPDLSPTVKQAEVPKKRRMALLQQLAAAASDALPSLPQIASVRSLPMVQPTAGPAYRSEALPLQSVALSSIGREATSTEPSSHGSSTANASVEPSAQHDDFVMSFVRKYLGGS